MINSFTQHERISQLVEWYVNSFEKGRIALYVFPLWRNIRTLPRILIPLFRLCVGRIVVRSTLGPMILFICATTCC